MNHDIAHCSKEMCKRKKDCIRYQAHIEALGRGLEFVTYLDLSDDQVEDCGLFMELKTKIK